MNDEHYAKEAQRLTNEAALIEAINRCQLDAMKALVTADAGNVTEILRLQARVRSFDEVLSELERAIISQAEPTGQAVS